MLIVFPVCVSGAVKDETAPQATLHPWGGPTFSSSCPGRPWDPDSYRQALLLICHTGSNNNSYNSSHLNTELYPDKVFPSFSNYSCLDFSSGQIQYKYISLSGAWLSSLDGDGVVRVSSHFLDGAVFTPSSVCLRTPTGQCHEADKSISYLWQTCLCQTGKCSVWNLSGPLLTTTFNCLIMY